MPGDILMNFKTDPVSLSFEQVQVAGLSFALSAGIDAYMASDDAYVDMAIAQSVFLEMRNT